MELLSNKLWVFSFLILIFAIIQSTHGKNFKEDVILTVKQKKLLEDFKHRVIERLPHDFMKEDIYLIKWLRNREFDVLAAEKKLMVHLRWREERRIDTIHDEDWSDVARLFPYYLEGRDKLGRPILYIDVGGLDLRRAIIQGQSDRLSRYAEKVVDEACILVRTLGKTYQNITRGQVIINAKGYNLIQHGCLRCIPFLLSLIPIYEEHYPECADQLIVLNTPSIIKPLLDVGIPLLSRETRESLQIYGTNKQMWKEVIMKKNFDFDQLPPAIGGTKLYKGMDTDY